MKILHINSYFSVSPFYKNLYDEQVKSGLDISVYVPVSSITDTNRDFGKYTIVSRAYSKIDRLFFYRKHTKIINDLQRKIEVKKFDVLHAHSLFSNGYVAMKVKEKYNIPYVVAVRNTDVNVFFKKMPHLRKLGIKILKDASQIIFLSESYKQQVFEEYIPENKKSELLAKVKIIPNGVGGFWLENKFVKSKNNECIKLIYVGNLDKNKNILTTLKAIDILKRKNISVNFTVVGKVVDQSIYNKVTAHPNVTYVGPQKKEKLVDLYRSHDIFVMPSIFESFGLVYVEAISQGLPVIYSKKQGFDGQFKEGEVGLSVESLNMYDLSDKILEIYNHYENYTKNLSDSADKFLWENISSEYILTYSSRLEERGI